MRLLAHVNTTCLVALVSLVACKSETFSGSAKTSENRLASQQGNPAGADQTTPSTGGDAGSPGDAGNGAGTVPDGVISTTPTNSGGTDASTPSNAGGTDSSPPSNTGGTDSSTPSSPPTLMPAPTPVPLPAPVPTPQPMPTPTPPPTNYPGTPATKVGINFEDTRGGDADYNDAVLCFVGQFAVDGSNVVSTTAQTVTATTYSHASCRHQLSLVIVSATGIRTTPYTYDSRANYQLNISFNPGSRLEVTMTSTSGGCDPGVTKSMHTAEDAQVAPNVCRSTGH